MESQKITREFAMDCIQNFNCHVRRTRKTGVFIEKEIKQKSMGSYYDLAKQQQTKARNLKNALDLYTKAVLNGEKVNSCIKDFASVLHQCGFTLEAINFLTEMKQFYKGDKLKYEKLINNLKVQIRPTGKHDYKNIMVDLVVIKLQEPQKEVLAMFENSSRIKSIKIYKDLGFQQEQQTGRYIVIKFDSFSAAKKTLQTFKQDQWFGVNKYWLDSQLYLVTEANNGKTDFQNGLVLYKGKIQKYKGEDVLQVDQQRNAPNFGLKFGYEGLQLVNQTSMYLIKYIYAPYTLENYKLKNDYDF